MLNLIPTSLGELRRRPADDGGPHRLPRARTPTPGCRAWTIFYWAWWVSWTPFVGMFIARISRGRTIRQFVTGVLLVPSVVSLVWFCIFGGAAIRLQQTRHRHRRRRRRASRSCSTRSTPTPWRRSRAIIVMILVAIFFVSGADAASIVMGTLSERGSHEPAGRPSSSGASRPERSPR